MVVHPDVTALIGGTPLVELRRFGADLPVRLVAKLESENPGGSVKDRIALAMIEAAEASGDLPPGGTFVEPTSGNTGIGLAMVAAAKGYSAVFTMPDSMSVERRSLIAAYGARIVLTPAAQGMRGAIEEARRLADENGWHMPQQFENRRTLMCTAAPPRSRSGTISTASSTFSSPASVQAARSLASGRS